MPAASVKPVNITTFPLKSRAPRSACTVPPALQARQVMPGRSGHKRRQPTGAVPVGHQVQSARDRTAIEIAVAIVLIDCFGAVNEIPRCLLEAPAAAVLHESCQSNLRSGLSGTLSLACAPAATPASCYDRFQAPAFVQSHLASPCCGAFAAGYPPPRPADATTADSENRWGGLHLANAICAVRPMAITNTPGIRLA